jgi:hypothetical protein
MVGIGIDHISITRRLPIDAGMLGHVLGRLRAETSGTTVSWNLGERGSCDLDVSFRAGGEPPVYASNATLHNRDRTASAAVTVTLAGCAMGEAQLEVHPSGSVGEWWSARLGAYLDLAHAALEELAQELLYQHARVQDELAD